MPPNWHGSNKGAIMTKQHQKYLLRGLVFVAGFMAVAYAALYVLNAEKPLPEVTPLQQVVPGQAQPSVYFGFSREECLGQNMAWNLDDKSCLNFSDLSLCYSLEGNWQYPAKCKE